jgi:hypothetical protein
MKGYIILEPGSHSPEFLRNYRTTFSAPLILVSIVIHDIVKWNRW